MEKWHLIALVGGTFVSTVLLMYSIVESQKEDCQAVCRALDATPTHYQNECICIKDSEVIYTSSVRDNDRVYD
jgi:hypothetical protein